MPERTIEDYKAIYADFVKLSEAMDIHTKTFWPELDSKASCTKRFNYACAKRDDFRELVANRTLETCEGYGFIEGYMNWSDEYISERVEYRIRTMPLYFLSSKEFEVKDGWLSDYTLEDMKNYLELLAKGDDDLHPLSQKALDEFLDDCLAHTCAVKPVDQKRAMINNNLEEDRLATEVKNNLIAKIESFKI